MSPEQRLQRRAAAQGGVVLRADALRSGFSAAQIATSLRTGRWTVVARGAYRLGPAAPLGSPEQARVKVAAAALISRRPVVAVALTAAHLHDLPLLRPPPARVQLLVAKDRDRVVPGHLRVAGLPDADVVQLSGTRVTAIPRTVVDLARELPTREAVVLADAALQRGVSPGEFSCVLGSCAGWPGVAAARRALGLARRGAQSPLETLGRLLLVELGYPEPELQFELADRDGLVAELDYWWAGRRLAGEADGLSKYDAPEVLRKEKIREDRIRDLGVEVFRFTWTDVHRDRALFADRLARAWKRAGRR